MTQMLMSGGGCRTWTQLHSLSGASTSTDGLPQVLWGGSLDGLEFAQV